MKKQTISLCVIVKDEADYLDRCLNSYKDLVDEIIVVDTGSKDSSVETAKKYGAIVKEIVWENDFSKARNISLQLATSDWIIWTDADDLILSAECEKIKVIRDEYPLDRCFSFMIKNSQDGILGSVFNQVRMFPNLEKIRFQFSVHEQVLPSIQSLGLKTSFTDIMVIHTGYSDPEIVKKKQIRNRVILEKEMEERADNPVVIYSYAGNLVDLEEYEKAVPFYEKAMKLAKEQKSEEHIAKGVPVALASLYGRIKEYSNSRKWADIAYRDDASHPQTNSILAELFEIEGNIEKAISHFEFVLTCKEEPTFIPVDVNMLKVNACSHLGGLYLKVGKPEKVVEILDRAIEIKTGKKPKPSDIGDVYFEKGNYLQAGNEYLRAVNSPDSNDWASFLGLAKIFIVDNSPEDAINFLEMAIERFPKNETLILLLADLLYDVKMVEKAEKLYLKIIEISENTENLEKAKNRVKV